MSQSPGIRVYNSTQEIVKNSLLDNNAAETNAIIQPKTLWEKTTPSGWNTVIIMPLPTEPSQHTFQYTLTAKRDLIIKRKAGELVLVPSKNGFPTVETDLTFSGHQCDIRCHDPETYFAIPCWSQGCIVFNDTNEPIRVCITDYYRRNTHVILEPGEHNMVLVPAKPTSLASDLIFGFFATPSRYASTLTITVVDMIPVADPVTAKLLSRAKCSRSSIFHYRQLFRIHFEYMRVVKVNGYYTIEEDTYDSHSYIDNVGAPYSYVLSKAFNQKIKSSGKELEIIKTADGRYDTIPYDRRCSIL